MHTTSASTTPHDTALDTPLDWAATQVRFIRGGGSQWPASFRLDKEWFRKNLLDYDFWYVYQGEAYLRDTHGHTHTLKQGTCVWMRPGSLFEVWRKPRSQFSNRYFHFKLLDPAGQPIDQALLDDIPLTCQLGHLPHFEALSRRMSDLIAMNIQTSEQQLAELYNQTISHMLKALLSDYLLATRMTLNYSQHGVEEAQFKVALYMVTLIHENPASFDIPDFAQRAGYSLDHLRRLVKRVIGQSPHQVLIQARLKRAKYLLRESDLAVTEIADQLGYANVHYFSLQFKKLTGKSPTEYRLR